MISIVCHKGPSFKRNIPKPIHMELEENQKGMKFEDKNHIEAEIINTASSLTLATVLDIFNTEITTAEFLKPALEWIYPKLLKQIGLLDSQGNVAILSSDMLKESDFFKLALNIQNFKKIREHALRDKSSEVAELTRKFLARFYHADGTCALFPEQWEAIGIPMTFPYPLSDLLDYTVPLTSANIDVSVNHDDVKSTYVHMEESTEAAPRELRLVAIILKQYGQRIKSKADVKPPGMPIPPRNKDLDETFYQDNAHVRVPIVEEHEEPGTMSKYNSIRPITGYVYVMLMTMASSFWSSGKHFFGLGRGQKPPQPPTSSGNEPNGKRVYRLIERRPRYWSPPSSNCCMTAGEIVLVMVILLLFYAFFEMYTKQVRKSSAFRYMH